MSKIKKKQLPQKKTDELPAGNRVYSAEDMTLIRKYNKMNKNVPARFKSEKNGDNPCIMTHDESDPLLHNARMMRAFGTSSAYIQQHFVTQLVKIFKELSSSANIDAEKLCTVCNMAIEILDALQPRDIIESMLITQMIGVHNMAMDTLSRAMRADQTLLGKEKNVYQATKMLRTYTLQMDCLKNYRRKGQQKVTVEHVNVNQGGQAIVGSVSKGGEE